jgi:putative ABC transport system permease protein
MIPVRYNLRSLLERRTTSLMTVLGLGMVATIFVILFGFIGGLKGTMLNAAGERNWVLLSLGATDETSSFVPHALIDIVRVRPEIATSESGEPLVSSEIFTGVNVSRDKHVRQFVLMPGVRPIAMKVHRNMRLVAGRWPIRGDGEWTIGQKVRARQPYLTLGTQMHFDGATGRLSEYFPTTTARASPRFGPITKTCSTTPSTQAKMPTRCTSC